ncbi:LysM peptidoglycan-binding domain-containing protein [Halonatronum saccharophilum]|uniref:LysM peptidoglycan-binding domain-containing protein n=1 Tax=Halonatronum saccharophilum TaxID=150060 RepID=UPI0004B7FCED|nr:LysM peptidoglycan-binding domain-containing protein [Halonatronum saccharophilum]
MGNYPRIQESTSNCPEGTRAYTVQAGDTFDSLARRFNTTVAAIVAANPGVEPDFLRVGQRICIPEDVGPLCPEDNYYTIRRGDTFYSIATRFNISPEELREANPVVNEDRLRVGQIICVPAEPPTPPARCPRGTMAYTVRRGDTYFLIARRYNTTVADLRRANPGVNPDALIIGQRLCVPTES